MSALVSNARYRSAPSRPSLPLRARVEEAIERLISMLDALDADPDLEDGGDTEPNCGDFGTYVSTDECEPDDEGDELDHGELDEAELAERWCTVQYGAGCTDSVMVPV